MALSLLAMFTIAACETLPLLTPTAFPAMGAAPDTATVYYVTDRTAERSGGAVRSYGHGRSASMAFGQAALSFDKLAVDFDSRLIRVRSVAEHVRFPATPLPFLRNDGLIVADQAAQAGYDAAGRDFQARVAQALRASGQDEVVVFVHGYKNDFDDALATISNIWQATGRSAVPIAYTWPADNPGLFGYFKDRESGEFSIFHLKETLRLLAEVRGLKHIQLIAHSRGTDVATSALREMIIAARAAGKDPRKVLKIDNLVLAAPDLDFDVVRQRLIAERFAPAFECITVYMNPNDGALGFAQAVNSGTRFGRLSFEDLGMTERDILNQTGNVYFIDVSGVVAPRGHSYFRENPVVLSDIVTLFRTGAPPGGPERNLSHIAANFWMLEQFPETTFEPFDR
ncbi:alpha/beta hydrolase [uncultured Roseovarius sp.]|uniref:alpha/beta hydrolase n=1 Tax=uncultured Roseovarius sp. TaxID=293344 RepID=UPI00261722B4|nr:alpha/beta hydrolase [uncultured Roseovarius sp.]